MRVMVNGDAATECLPKIEVMDGSDSWIDLTSRLFSVSLNDSIDADSASCSLQFRNNPDKWVTVGSNYNLDPLDTSSLYYSGGESLLGHYHEVKLSVSKDAGSNYYIVFQGYAGPGSVSVSTSVKRNDTVTLVPCDLSFPYKEYHFYDSLVMKDASATSMMTQIFADRGFNQTVTVIDDPGYNVEEIETGQTNVWDAQKSLITPTGYSYRIKFNAAAFKPCVYDPDRTKTTPDATFSGTFQYRKIDVSEADIRTKVVIIYRLRGAGTIEYAQAESESARDKYGIPDGYGGKLHKTIWIAMQGSGNRYNQIDTPAEAQNLANYVLSDLQYPTPDIEVKLPRVNPGIECHDLLSFVGDDYTVTMGVTAITWSWDTDNPYGTTSIKGTTDRVVGEFGTWLSQDAHSPDVQKDLALAFLQGDGRPPARPATPTLLSFQGIDSATGKETTTVVAEVTPNKEWDLAGYTFFWAIEGESETESRTVTEPRLVIKDLPAGKTVRVWVQAFDWSAKGLT